MKRPPFEQDFNRIDIVLVNVRTATDGARLAALKQLKTLLPKRLVVDAKRSGPLLTLLTDDLDWREHVALLQILRHLSVPANQQATLYARLREGILHSNLFVRAWSYGGLATVAAQYPEYRQEVREILKMGLRDEPAAVKARIRAVQNVFM